MKKINKIALAVCTLSFALNVLQASTPASDARRLFEDPGDVKTIWENVLSPAIPDYPTMANTQIAEQILTFLGTMLEQKAATPEYWSGWKKTLVEGMLDEIEQRFASNADFQETFREFSAEYLVGTAFEKFDFAVHLRALEEELQSADPSATDVREKIANLMSNKVSARHASRYDSFTDFENEDEGVGGGVSGLDLFISWLSSNDRELILVRLGISTTEIDTWITQLERYRDLPETAATYSEIAQAYIDELTTHVRTHPFSSDRARISAQHLIWLKDKENYLTLAQVETINQNLERVAQNSDVEAALVAAISQDANAVAGVDYLADFTAPDYNHWTALLVEMDNMVSADATDVRFLHLQALAYWLKAAGVDNPLSNSYQIPDAGEAGINAAVFNDLGVLSSTKLREVVQDIIDDGIAWQAEHSEMLSTALDKLSSEFVMIDAVQADVVAILDATAGIAQFRRLDYNSVEREFLTYFNQTVNPVLADSSQTAQAPVVLQNLLNKLDDVVSMRVDALSFPTATGVEFSLAKLNALVQTLQDNILFLPAVAAYQGVSTGKLKMNFTQLAHRLDSSISTQELVARLDSISKAPVVFSYFVDTAKVILRILRSRTNLLAPSQVDLINRYKNIIKNRGGDHARRLLGTDINGVSLSPDLRAENDTFRGFLQELRGICHIRTSNAGSAGYVGSQISLIDSQNKIWNAEFYTDRMNIESVWNHVKSYTAWRADLTQNEQLYPFIVMVHHVLEMVQELLPTASTDGPEEEMYNQILQEIQEVNIQEKLGLTITAGA